MFFVSIFDFILLVPEFFIIFYLFSLSIFLLVISTSKLFKYPLVLIPGCWITLFNLSLSIFLYLNHFFDNYFFLNNLLISNLSLIYIKIFIICCTIIIILVSLSYLKFEKINDFEFIILILFTVLGNFFLISAFDTVIAYLAIEIQSLSLYVLVAFNKNTLFSTEAGIKYFILGTFASILLLLGFALHYLVFGTLNFYDISLLCSHFIGCNILRFFIYAGILCIFTGLLFKLTAAPFHIWAPDVYEGAPSPVTMYMTIVSKIGIFIFLLRLFLNVFSSFIYISQNFLIFVAITSIIVGSFVGLNQFKIKRLFVYSSINHIGFILLGLSIGTLFSIHYAFIYFFFYTLMLFNFWVVFLSLRLKIENRILVYITDLKNILEYNPLLKAFFTINLFSMAGMPPLIGFVIKYLIILSALDSSLYIVSIFIIFVSVISVFYYVRIVKILYFDSVISLNLLVNFQKENLFFSVFFSFFLIILSISPQIIFLLAFKVIYFLV